MYIILKGIVLSIIKKNLAYKNELKIGSKNHIKIENMVYKGNNFKVSEKKN